jgi:hypothetical protein
MDINGCQHPSTYNFSRAFLSSDYEPTREVFKSKLDKIEANLLLASTLGSSEDFERLIQTRHVNAYTQNFVLDASPTSGESFPVGFCAKVITPHAAAALLSTGIERLDISGNSRLVALPIKELCSIGSLKYLDCDGCTSLTTLPESVKKEGLKDMRALHESLGDPIYEFLHGRCVPPARVQELPSARISEFGSLLDDPTSADVTFVVDNERITAHRNVLAACPTSAQCSPRV